MDLCSRIQLLLLPICTLNLYFPKSSKEERSGNRKKLQTASVNLALARWKEPEGCIALLQQVLQEHREVQKSRKQGKQKRKTNVEACKKKLSHGHYTAAIRILSSNGVVHDNPDTLYQLQQKHPHAPSPTIPIDTITAASVVVGSQKVLKAIRSFPKGTSCGRDGLRAQHLLDELSGPADAVSKELLTSIAGVVNLWLSGVCHAVLGPYIASAPLTPLLKPDGGLRPIAVGTMRRLCSTIAATTVGSEMANYLGDHQFGVGIPCGGEIILHASNRILELKEHYDQQLLGYLHHIVTDDGARFGILQQRLATLPFKEGGFEVYTMADASHYCYMASQIQKQHLQNTILSSIDTSETSHNYQYSLNKYMQVCDLSTFSTNSVSPHPIKALAAQYFDVVKRKLPTKFTLTTRDAFLWQSNKLNHVMDFLKAIPIPGLGQSLGPRQFRVVAQYRLGIPLFPEDSKCSCCGRAMDVYGDHALHCASEVGIKFRHNLVRDLVMDICYRSGVAAGKEVALGFLSDNNNALKPADILIYNWENGQDTCFDVTGVSPFSSGVIRSFIPGHAISAAVTRKCN
ncbi:uncharacterized protein LOC113297214 [Papaver somniferum]|uniref:uncharacterized protein LOC113297214 n=1 Tax=Papaver somniferum TaxID=3469 RepID=UPI000E6FE8FA|nr:uncharacterized protein LOC113297214 [Papaver somniferum]XP_026401421.1 uncharacterized protein LOC113297214 [Papaver somniferum]